MMHIWQSLKITFLALCCFLAERSPSVHIISVAQLHESVAISAPGG
jgi:hypothetical protein